MARYNLEPGHTSADFKVRHMMVTWVRGTFRPISGSFEFDPENPSQSSVDISIDASTLWSGDKDRDNHLKNEDFLDVAKHPNITFKSTSVEALGASEYCITGDLTLKGVTKQVNLITHYMGSFPTPFWEDGKDKGPVMRAGFVAEVKINRTDFGVSWNGMMDRGGVVVGNDVHITIDAEGLEVKAA